MNKTSLNNLLCYLFVVVMTILCFVPNGLWIVSTVLWAAIVVILIGMCLDWEEFVLMVKKDHSDPFETKLMKISSKAMSFIIMAMLLLKGFYITFVMFSAILLVVIIIKKGKEEWLFPHKKSSN